MAKKSEAMTLSRSNVAFITFLLAVPILYTDLSDCSNEDGNIKGKKIKTKPPGCLHMHVPKSSSVLGLSFAKSFLYTGLNKQLY